MAFLQFMASGTGRILRVAVGIVLIGAGLWAVGGTAGYVVAAIGLVPLAAGILDVCLIGPLFGQSFYGAEIRARAQDRGKAHA